MKYKTDYDLMAGQLRALAEDVEYGVTNLANASALLYDSMEAVNWAGFYLRKDNQLILGPFQGKPACTKIPMGKGVCGTAASLGETQLVEDVHQFPGHIACDCASNSEIVIPLYRDETLYGVLDIDSPELGRFDWEDQKGLELFARTLESCIL